VGEMTWNGGGPQQALPRPPPPSYRPLFPLGRGGGGRGGRAVVGGGPAWLIPWRAGGRGQPKPYTPPAVVTHAKASVSGRGRGGLSAPSSPLPGLRYVLIPSDDKAWPGGVALAQRSPQVGAKRHTIHTHTRWGGRPARSLDV